MIMTAPYYTSQAGPSRYDMVPPAPPSKSPSLSFPSIDPASNPSWGNGPANGLTDRHQGDDSGESSKRNPLVDLMDSEKIYVEQLGLVIRVSLLATRFSTLRYILT